MSSVRAGMAEISANHRSTLALTRTPNFNREKRLHTFPIFDCNTTTQHSDAQLCTCSGESHGTTMADVDEDVIPRSGPPAEDIDLSEETQDFRFLAAIS